jgi:hypothetical protein
MDDMTSTAIPPPAGGLLERLLSEAEAMASQASPASVPSPPTEVQLPAVPPAASAPSEAASSGDIPPASATPQGGGVNPLTSLLANPAVLSALPTLMENLSPLLSGLGHGTGSAPSATRPHTADRHTALLCALKPYLSPHRRDTAETVIRLCRVWDALERSGISLTGLLGTVGGGLAASQERGNGHVQ